MRREHLEQRAAELRRELAQAEAELAFVSGPAPASGGIGLLDLFDLDDIQALQDAFSSATGVASIITTPTGEPLTKPSNFCSLCQDVIRKTEKGLANCKQSDAFLGRHNQKGASIQPCLSGGLWDGGASISVGGRHIASWLIGQIRNEHLDEKRMVAYAREIGADETEFMRALTKVTVMPLDQFKEVGQALFLFANLMSLISYQNLQLKESVRELQASHKEILSLRNYLSNIIDSIPSMLVGVDAEGRITHWNMRAADATGYVQRDVEGRYLVEVLPKLAGELQRLSATIAEGRPVVRERMPEDVDGERHYHDVFVYPLIANGVKGAVVRVDDATEKVRIQEMMIQSEKMLSVGGLAAGLAHEVNNPLAAILGSARLLDKRLLGDGRRNREAAEACGITREQLGAYVRQREVDTLVGAIIESGERAGRVVSNMLGFSRKGGGDCREEDVRDILDKAVELVRSAYDLEQHYNFMDVEFVREYADGPLLVYCEASRLQQVFFNILKNGAQAMIWAEPETGRPPRFVLRCSGGGERVRIEIEDNGPGMDEAVRRRVFEPFFTTKGPGVGTGLGMSVSSFIVTENLGGSMQVQSTLGQGTVFLIELPFAGAEPSA